jgi:cysteine desulfurase
MDNNATTSIAGEVVEAMLPFLKELYGNPSSPHSFGGQVAKYIEKAREQVARLIGASSREIFFTSCGTESDNAAIRGILEAHPERRHVVTTRVEHAAVLNLCKHLERKGYPVTYLSVNRKGELDLDEARAAITKDTAVVSIMAGNNETGVLFPFEEVARMAKEVGAFFHTDAVQAVGKIPIDISKSRIDLLSLSGHKLHGPKGVGALYIKRGCKFRPFLIGGHQESGRRGGTENVASIVGLGRACALASEHMEEESSRVRALRDKLESEILRRIPDCIRNGHPDNRLPNTSNISFQFVEGEAILLMMDRLGICGSSGSACTSGSLEPSHVLRAMGVPFTFSHGSIRFSLSRYNTEEEVDFVVDHMSRIIERLRRISPFAREKVAKR